MISRTSVNEFWAKKVTVFRASFDNVIALEISNFFYKYDL